jgi:hypothetical protein
MALNLPAAALSHGSLAVYLANPPASVTASAPVAGGRHCRTATHTIVSDQQRSASQTRGHLSFPDDSSHGAAGHSHPMRGPTPTTSIEHKHTLLQYPIYRSVQPIFHLVGALSKLTTDAQHFAPPDVARGCDPLQRLLPGRAPHILKDLLHQSIVLWRSITPLVVPCLQGYTATCRLKLGDCGYPCHNCLLAYQPNVWFAA